MVSYILVIAIFNLALGYGAAAALADNRPWGRWRWTRPRRRVASTAASGFAAAPFAATSCGAVEAAFDELPPPWLAQLAAAGIVARSFLEGASQSLRLEVGRYREQLIGIETRCRSLLVATDGTGLKLLAEDLCALNQRWQGSQRSAARLLAERAGRLGDQAAAQTLEQVLLDQAAQIQAINVMLAGLNFGPDAESSGKQMLDYVAALVAAAHTLRDQTLDLVATLIRRDRRLAEVPQAARLDADTGLPGRLGLESILADWSQQGTEGRPLAAVYIDIDRFSRINQRLGTRAGDQALVAAAKLIDELVRAEREHDRVCRVAGQSLLVVLTDAGPRDALAAAEQLRQSFEATTFDDQGTTFELTVSCGVVSATREGGAAELLRRALAAVQFAKKAGRNRCALDEGQGPLTLDPPQLAVKGRTVRLGG